jgi:uncharacterized protein YcgI (DUF1989 family)
MSSSVGMSVRTGDYVRLRAVLTLVSVTSTVGSRVVPYQPLSAAVVSPEADGVSEMIVFPR